MAAQANGRANKPKNSTANGSPNGHANGGLNGHADNTKVAGPVAVLPAQKKATTSFVGTSASVITRLTIWYLIITFAFRCPSSTSELSETSPLACKPYLQVRSHATPYVDPYYQAYVAPQVEKVQPYWDRFDAQLYTPVATFTKDNYATYGAHRVEQAKQYLGAQWDKRIQPQLQTVQNQVEGQYRLHLEPHVKKVADVVSPYYEQTKESTLEIYDLTLLPAYELVLPYSHQAYVHGHYAMSHFVIPYIQSAKEASWTFITRTLWPQLRVLYGDNVEPQLVRIRERLGRRRDQQKMESAVEALQSDEPTVSEKEVTKTTETIAESVAPHAPSATTSATEKVKSKTATQPEEPKLTGAELREKLNEDLRQWQTKFAVAADKGSEDLEQRVAEITERQVQNGVKGHGAALVIQLEQTAESTISKFKQLIKKTVESIPEEATAEDLEKAYERCISKTRELGLAVKDKAQAVRSWKATYDEETDSLVRAAVASTVEVLERIHGLGLQEVGMRWAWTDGVTYKDWQKYHKLRNTLTEWQAEVEAVGSQHEGLKVAHDEAKALEDKAMATASQMVNELVRLKGVSKWKIWAADSTDDFSQREVPARVFKAAKNIASNVEELASKASGSIIGSDTPKSESIASAVQEKFSDASSGASSHASAIQEKASEATSKVSEVVHEAGTAAKSIASEATQKAKSIAQEGGETVKEKISLAAHERKQQKVLGGVNAEVIVEARDIIFDDEDEHYSQKLHDMVAGAGDRAAHLSKAVSEALLGPSKTQGSVESVSSLAKEQYDSALAAASRVLYGTEKQPIDSVTSVASERFAEAVTAASYAIYGTPTPTAIIKTFQVQASSKYDQAVSLANEQYSNAKSQISVLVSGTPKPAHETLLALVDQAYSDSLAAATDRLQLALKYTDSIKSYTAGPTQGYYQSVSSIAASKLSEGLSVASAQFGSQPTPALEGARRQYYEAVGLAHVRYQEFLDSASSAVHGPQQGTVQSIASDISEYAQSAASNVGEAAESLASQASSSIIGSETPWTESMASRASQNWEALIAKASTQVYGQPTPWAGSVYSQAGAYGAQATASVAAQYAAVQALISELVVGKEPDFTESVMNRFSSAYYTGIPAAISAAGSYANENYEAASSLASANIEAAGSYAGESYDHATSIAAEAYDSASSVVSSIFTPPPAIETILSQASDQINLAVQSASVAVYGTSKGSIEQAGDSVASAYSSVQSKASEAIFGTQQAQDSFAAVAASAQAAISEAIYGPPTATGFVASATDGAGSAYSSIASVVGDKAADTAASVSSAIYGPEQGAIESASSRVAAAVDAANSRISELYAGAAVHAQEAASSVSSVVTAATQSVKDEL